MRATTSVLAFLTLLCVPALDAADTPDSKLTGELPRVLEEAGEDELIPVSVILVDQLTGPRLREQAAHLRDPEERRRVLAAALKGHAERTQGGLRDLLERAESLGAARRVRHLWIGNIVAAELTPEQILLVAGRPEVDRVNWAPERPVFLDAGGGGSAVECGVDLMRAPLVWGELANTGDGAVIAVIDSGVCWSHPDIANQIWVNPGEDLDSDGVVMDADDMNGVDDDGNGYIDDLIGYDIENDDSDPDDNNSHGSHVAGTVAGDGTSGTQAGMAPDAGVMVLRVGLSTSDEPDVWEAMQYAADNGADSISMSLGWRHIWGPDRTTWRNNCENTIDLGTAMVIAAGNEGQGDEPDNVRTPGDVPRIISVGATDCSDNAAGFSSRGPVTWQDVPPFHDHPYPPGLTKPDVSAPGVSTQSHNFCAGYSSKSGTSMATPHVAGAVALMKAANPGLTHDDLKLLLEETAIDLGPAGKDNTYGSGRVDAYEAVLRSQSSDGIVSVREATVACVSALNLVVTDFDLRGAGTVAVEVSSDTEPVPEVVNLTETSSDSGVFTGSISTSEGSPVPDGTVQVGHADAVLATYVDADDGLGGSNVPKSDTAQTDCLEPLISNVGTKNVTDVSAVIQWSTDEISDSVVTYGVQVPPTQSVFDSALVQEHAVTLGGLTECTIYYYEVGSTDAYGNGVVDDNGGEYYVFESFGDFGEGLQPCHRGTVSLDRTVVSCTDAIDVELVDIDLNLSSTVADTAIVDVSSTSEAIPETLLLVETGPNTSRFAGSISTAPGPVVEGDGILQTAHGDFFTATYHDADDGTGSPNVDFRTGDADCEGARATTIVVQNLTDESVEVRVVTSEPTTATVDWGTTPALGQQVADAALASTHTFVLQRLEECGPVYFRVATTDAYGNDSAFDAAGAPFRANAQEIPGALFKDEFASDTGWTLQGEWERGAPQGLGSSPGDPSEAYVGTAVLGHDLSGQGSAPGDYEPQTEERAISPVIDGSALANGEIKFRRWLNVGGGGISYVEVNKTGSWVTVWTSQTLGVADDDWTLETVDISQFADGNGSLQIAFRQFGGLSPAANRSGWNVDRFVVRDGSLPDFAACGGCGGSPTFAGVEAAADADPCGDTGITVSWSAAPAWGTGAAGTYAVYRDTDPAFVPSGANLVASGISGTSWTDAGALNDVTLHYVVRAETDETCSTGPFNGGVTDDNLVRAAAVDQITQPAPGDLADSLRVDPVNAAHARLTWSPTATASRYHVYRADSVLGPFTRIAEVEGSTFDDRDQLGTGGDVYYVVEAADACGNE